MSTTIGIKEALIEYLQDHVLGKELTKRQVGQIEKLFVENGKDDSTDPDFNKEVVRDKNALYTFFRIDFKDWGEEFDYTIVDSIDNILPYLQMAEIHLDDPSLETEVKITGVPMTESQFEKWVEENQP